MFNNETSLPPALALVLCQFVSILLSGILEFYKGGLWLSLLTGCLPCLAVHLQFLTVHSAPVIDLLYLFKNLDLFLITTPVN